MSSTPPAPPSPATPSGPAYSVRTPRLLLRCYEPSDAAPRLEAVASSGEHLHEFFPPQPEGPLTLGFHLAPLRKMRGNFDLDQDRAYAVVDPQTGRFLGEVGLLTRAGIAAREVGYWLRRDAIGQGLATETLLSTEYPHGPAHAVPIEAFDILGQRIL
ncbi:MAG TPA: GNAT family N-acetyltransferase [Archangium sp.]|nr:GNAT family N-acetyltransferase [Archangium sp.]